MTSSSLEVFAALALTDSEFSDCFCVLDDAKVPPFYEAYVADVLKIIERNAQVFTKTTSSLRHNFIVVYILFVYSLNSNVCGANTSVHNVRAAHCRTS